jgi:hypothetical protein
VILEIHFSFHFVWEVAASDWTVPILRLIFFDFCLSSSAEPIGRLRLWVIE